MSQHVFRDNGYEVLVGWDKPLQYFFLVIETRHKTVFSNLDLEDPAMTLEAIETIFDRFRIKPPSSLFQSLLGDKLFNVGSTRVEYED